MSDIQSNERFLKVGRNGFVTADDVAYLRDNVFPGGINSKSDLAILLGLAERAPDGDRAWTEFFGEAAGDYYLREEIPHDYITEREFQELKASVTQYSETVTPLVLAMLIKLVQDATATPPMMEEFICQQIKSIIGIRDGNPAISENNAAMIRSFLFANSRDENRPVSRREATLLFDLNDMTMASHNHPAWSELFLKAIANHLMAQIGYTANTRQDALSQWDWIQDQSVDVSVFFRRMLSGGLASLRQAYTPTTQVSTGDAADSVFEHIVRSRELRAMAGDDGGEHNADWLAARIGRDGFLDDNERTLVAFMQEFESELPASLKTLVSHSGLLSTCSAEMS